MKLIHSCTSKNSFKKITMEIDIIRTCLNSCQDFGPLGVKRQKALKKITCHKKYKN
jgi:hypothetical protein